MMKLLNTVKSTIIASTLLVANSIFAAPVNINSADAQTIAENLKGIGQSKATAVVTYREQNGKFMDLNSLTLVKGIGSKTVEKNKDDILF
ncbi:MAG: helix-hairpin-helix domain-containing protein [Gammaproteobacteria bacterium]|nr:helix-hairpin-helix domain-containing protein [Gammaproteobacteria bacterium]